MLSLCFLVTWKEHLNGLVAKLLVLHLYRGDIMPMLSQVLLNTDTRFQFGYAI